MFYGDCSVKVTFWLLDINPKIDEEKGTIEMWLWGIDSAGNRVLVIDRNFIAYFYVVVTEGVDASKIANSIRTTYAQSIVKADVVARRFFGQPVMAIRVCCKIATETGKIAKQLRSFEGVADCLEEDVRASMRYLIDNNLAPCGWLEVEAIEEENSEEVRVAKIFEANLPPKQLDETVMPVLKVLSFSMICYSREGSPKPDRNPVLIISTSASNGETRQFIADEDKNDKPVIEAFIAYIRRFDPDIIASYGANTVDWTYLKRRSHKLKMKMDFDRAHLEPHTSVYGHVSTTGIVNVDLADFMDVFPEVKVKNLWNFANHLGIMKERQNIIEDVEFADYWDDKQKRGELERFGLDSACKVQGMASLLLDFAMQLASLNKLATGSCNDRGCGFPR